MFLLFRFKVKTAQAEQIKGRESETETFLSCGLLNFLPIIAFKLEQKFMYQKIFFLSFLTLLLFCIAFGRPIFAQENGGASNYTSRTNKSTSN